jgi:Arc/MetJ-type ribon-helix-helix transcriptional regulator
MRRSVMKIVTVNIPESYLESIERLIGEDGLYPSRSELIRCAVRDFLIKELRRANEMIKFKEVKVEELDDKNFVRVPIEKMDENNEPVREFKTYKIIKRLEY